MTAPERMDCHAVAARLYEYLDAELSLAMQAEVRAHLNDCRGCFSLFTFERAYVRFLAARASARTAPAHLRQRIFEHVLFGEDDTDSA